MLLDVYATVQLHKISIEFLNIFLTLDPQYRAADSQLEHHTNRFVYRSQKRHDVRSIL